MFGRKKSSSDLDWQPQAGESPDTSENHAHHAQQPALTQQAVLSQQATSGYASDSDASDALAGLIHPMALVRFFGRNFGAIAAVTIAVVGLGLGLYLLSPNKYHTKALILVDPRLPRVTSSETVLSGIGGDAAALTSYVEIMNSDGFLGKVVDELGVKDDPEFAAAQSRTELIGMFRDNLGAYRQGATYIVEVSYVSKNKDNAAKYANGVASAFVRDQKDFRSSTSADATQWLSERLETLRSNLKISEDAVAAYRARNGIVDTGAQGTLDNQQLASLVNQLATTTTELAEARARYEQASKDGVPASANLTQTGEFTNLDQLLQEQDRLRRQAAELNQSLGSRHPRILSNAEQQRIIANQITQERKRLVQRAEQAFETAKAKQQSLERQLADARQRSITQNSAMVELATLEREANANRNLYEQFLARYKITDEQSQFNFNEARIVSEAPVPVKSTKPSLVLVLPVLFILGGILGTLFAMIREAFRAPDPHQTRLSRQNHAAVSSSVSRTDPVQAAAKSHDPETDTAIEDEQPDDPSPLPAGAYFDVAVKEEDKRTARKARKKARKKATRDLKPASNPLLRSRRSGSTSRPRVPEGPVVVPAVASASQNDLVYDIAVQPLSAQASHQAEATRQANAAQARAVEVGSEHLDDREETVVNIDKKRSKTQRTAARRARQAWTEAPALEAERPAPTPAFEGHAILITLPDMGVEGELDDEDMFDDLVSTHQGSLSAFVGKSMKQDSISLLVTAAQPGEGQSITTDLVREFAIEQGYHPVVISLQDRAQKAQRRVQANATGLAPARMVSLQEFEDFDQIPFVNAAGLSDGRGLAGAVAQELASLIALCKENYGFVILETGHILEPETLDDLIDMVDTSLMVVSGVDLGEDDLADWQDWATDCGAGLVLDQTQN